MQLSGIMGKYNCNAISFDDILLQEYSWIMEKEIAIYHGSNKIIRKPVYGAGNPFNDYGRRIYCTPDVEFAKEWAVWQPRKVECDSRVRHGYFDSWKEPRKREETWKIKEKH